MIRSARPDDVPVIHQMIIDLAVYEREPDAVKATEEDLHAALFGPQPALFGHVAQDPDGAVVGFALWFLNYSTWLGTHGVYLEDLYVRPEARGAGYGKQLLSTLAAICIERGYKRLEWWVLDWNKPSRDFYEALGADPLTEWVPYRVTGQALASLAQGNRA